MKRSILKAGAVVVVVAVLAATATAASYVPAVPLPGDFLPSSPILYIAANAIVFLLVFSYRQSSSSASHEDDVHSLYPSSEHGLFASAVFPDEVAAPVPAAKRQPREAKIGKKTDRARARRKPGAEEKPPKAVGRPEAEAKPDGEGQKPSPRDVKSEDTEDVSMESAWLSIVQRGAARPVAMPKSETWGGEELPRMRRAAEKAVARREMRKSATMIPPSPPRAPAAATKQGWRTRDVLGMAHDELLRRAESFIRRQHEHLRLQRQESDQRQAVEAQHRRRGPLWPASRR